MTAAFMAVEGELEWLKAKSREWFGASDDLGTLNFLSCGTVLKAKEDICSGETVSLSRPIRVGVQAEKALYHFGPPLREVLMMPKNDELSEDGQPPWSIESWSLVYHGYLVSHADAWSHCSWRGKCYGDRKAVDLVTAEGGAIAGEVRGDKPVFTRAVLVDLTTEKTPWLEPGRAVTVNDIETALHRCNLDIRKGDCLLVRTGHTRSMHEAVGGFSPSRGNPGLHWSVPRFLATKQVSILGTDVPTDCIPPIIKDFQSPVHVLCLVGLGMPLLDNLDLEELATKCTARQNWAFAISIAPLKLQGGTGSPLNPIALL